MLFQPNSTRVKPAKYLAIGLLGLGLLISSTKSFAQSAPPTPPPPDEVLKGAGKTLKSINPFKKNKSRASAPAGPQLGAPPAGGPPPPPNPLNLFKKKKGGSVLPPPPGPGRD